MKVLQLISSIGFFGAESSMTELSLALPDNMYHCHIGIIGSSGHFPEAFLSLAKKKGIGVKAFPCNRRFDLSTILKIRRYIKSNQINIVHSHNYKSNFYSYLAGFNTGVKRITTCHNWLSHTSKMKLYELIDKWLLRKFDKIIAVSEALRDEVIKSGIKKDKVRVIHNGLDPDRFAGSDNRQEIRKVLGLKEGEKVIGTIGRLAQEKGQIYLIRAFVMVLKKFSEIKLLIVGDGPLRGDLESAVCDLELTNHVIFTGVRNDIPQMLGVMDLFVLPSLTEAMPIALLEAMAARKPIIASKVGAIPKVIQDSQSGLLIEPENMNLLSGAIERLLSDHDLAVSLANSAQAKVASEFSAKKMAKEYSQTYDYISQKKVILVEISGKGGICHYTYNLAQALSNYAPVILATSIHYELGSLPISFTLTGIFNRYRTNPLSFCKLIAIAKKNNVKAVHFQLSQHPAFVLFFCYLIKYLTGKKIIITAHNVVSHEKKGWERIIYRKLYMLADEIIVHAQVNKNELTQAFNIRNGKISVIPHGNYMFFNNDIKHSIASRDKFNILFFGYIRKYKGLLYLIRALAKVKVKIPDVKLHIVGEPVEDFAIYLKEIKDLGLENNIELSLNYVPFEQVKDYFYEANVVVLPYLNIYQSGILQLAYGFGRPVVVTDVGGLREAVEDGKSGYVVAPKDSAALADRIIALLSNYELQNKMGDYALYLASTKFSWDTISKETFNLYQ